MTTPEELESFARQIAEPDFPISHASLDPLIGHLNTADYARVLDRAAEIAREAALRGFKSEG
jgi:hypothetical protein